MSVAAGLRVLDRPVWESLAGRHTALSVGGPLAKRYLRDVNLFASAHNGISSFIYFLDMV